tara:strand:+ start:1109 stop:1294 length:186 start_codon:yes stop_codon:yes gene_type:complete
MANVDQVRADIRELAEETGWATSLLCIAHLGETMDTEVNDVILIVAEGHTCSKCEEELHGD